MGDRPPQRLTSAVLDRLMGEQSAHQRTPRFSEEPPTTVDVGPVHTLSEAGDCLPDCPHPSHLAVAP